MANQEDTAMSVMSAINDTISISLFNRGLAGQVFEDVKKTGPKVVIKNNTPECVLLPPEEYVSMVEEINDARLLAVAENRMKDYDPEQSVSETEVLSEFGLTEADLADADKVAIE